MSSSPSPHSSTSPRSRAGLYGGTVIVAGALLWWFSRGTPPPAPRTDTSTNNSTNADPTSSQPATQPPTQLAEDASAAPNANAAAGDASARLPQGTVLVRATWGSGPDQLGHNRPQEANPEAPMSSIVGPDGTIHVLDQVNRRIQRFSRDGRFLGSTPIGLLGAQDIALTRDGSYVVMDRLADRTIAIVGPDGTERGRLPITGENVERTGNVTGVFVDGNNVLVEREHGPLVRVGDSSGGDTSNREEVPGRPTRDGRLWVTTAIVSASEGRMYLNAVARPSREHVYTREYRVPLELRTIVMLDSDANGVVYLGVTGVSAGQSAATSDGGAESERVLLMCVDGATGRTIGQTTLPPNTSADETFREFTVPDQGGVIYAVRSEQGVEYRQYDCR